jgi:glycosyltransferase involved in cell wall biosynthesis
VVVSVHDVSFIEHPEYFTPTRATQLRLTVHRTVSRAARIITGSDFSRDSIARAYGLNGDKIVVIPNAASEEFKPLPREAAGAWVRSHFRFQAPFILTVGDLQPRKNQGGLIRAFSELLRIKPHLPHHLVLAGKESWRGAEARRAALESGVAARIHFVGFVHDATLLQLYSACEFFIFPSFYEGFGLPVLEAMACGKAVACSSSSAVHEVADAAAVLFDPHSTSEMTRAMLDLILHPELRLRTERIGLQRSAQFSWRRTAEKTLEVYYEVAGGTTAQDRERVAAVSVAHP